MKKLLSILTILSFATGASFADCGKKVTDEGKLKAADTAKKEITIETADGKTVSRKLTAATKTTAKDGKEAAIDALVGKSVTVVSEHSKVDSVSEK